MLEALQKVAGSEYVLTDEASRVFYAQDVFTKDLPAMAVVQPGDTRELASTVATVTAAGHAVIARGGGMSYTSGYVPKEEGTVIVDTQRMNRVLEINAEDMYVRVEAGCTWKKLYDALQGTGLRTPYWGTLSGIHATVGGGASQNSIFWGSARHGTAADSIIGFEVVLADGSIVRTGSGAQKNGSPFFRHYGPDLTGLFTCDTGALGLKATVTLRLIPAGDQREFLSFDFGEHQRLIAAMSEIGRLGAVEECFGFDPRLQAIRMQRDSMLSDVKKFAGVLKASGSVLGAIKEGTRMAIAGRGFMKNVTYSMHVSIEELCAAAAQHTAQQVRDICARQGGKEIENSIPKILRANPFTPLNNMVGPNGELWTPVHALVSHSQAREVYEAVEAIFDRHSEVMEQYGIGHGFLLAAVSTNCFVVELVFFTPDALNELHKATIGESALRRMPCFESNPDARNTTAAIRDEIIAMFCDVGGVHMQIGKSYPYRDGLRPESWQVVEAVKKTVDPRGRVNPGSLGLD